jgi:hypothetical protein
VADGDSSAVIFPPRVLPAGAGNLMIVPISLPPKPGSTRPDQIQSRDIRAAKVNALLTPSI